MCLVLWGDIAFSPLLSSKKRDILAAAQRDEWPKTLQCSRPPSLSLQAWKNWWQATDLPLKNAQTWIFFHVSIFWYENCDWIGFNGSWPSPVNLFALALCVIQHMRTKKTKYGLSSALAVEKTLTSAKSSSHALYGVWTLVIHGKKPSLLISYWYKHQMGFINREVYPKKRSTIKRKHLKLLTTLTSLLISL